MVDLVNSGGKNCGSGDPDRLADGLCGSEGDQVGAPATSLARKPIPGQRPTAGLGGAGRAPGNRGQRGEPAADRLERIDYADHHQNFSEPESGQIASFN